MSALLLGAGTMHFVAPSFFDSTVPRQLPGQARTYTQVSGVAELAIGAALAVPKTRKLGAGLAAALFVAVFPANIQMAIDWCRSPKTSTPQKIGSIARLPLQVPLVTEALKLVETQANLARLPFG
ncbi:membrane protein [Rhodococcus qingshengii]|nr:membrane protein [Rhodococcus qingshengii]